MNLYKTYRWQKLRDKALKRDHVECQWCKEKGKVVKATVIHHIKEADKYPDLFFELPNLVSLCRECHEKHHGRLKNINEEEKFPEWW